MKDSLSLVIQLYKDYPEFFILAVQDPITFRQQAIGNNEEFEKLNSGFRSFFNSRLAIPAKIYINANKMNEYKNALLGELNQANEPGGLLAGDDKPLIKFYSQYENLVDYIVSNRVSLETCIVVWYQNYLPAKPVKDLSLLTLDNKQFIEKLFNEPDFFQLATKLQLTKDDFGKYYEIDMQRLEQALNNMKQQIQELDLSIDPDEFQAAVFNLIDEEFEIIVEEELEKSDGNESDTSEDDKPGNQINRSNSDTLSHSGLFKKRKGKEEIDQPSDLFGNATSNTGTPVKKKQKYKEMTETQEQSESFIKKH